jgi:hypothetical protein
MRKKHTELAEAPFLDVVTNLIGILIIIIMVTGPRATDAMVDAVVEAKTATAAQAATNDPLAAARHAATAVERDIHEIDGKLKRQALEIGYRGNERDKLLAVVTAAEQNLKQRQQELSAEDQAQLATKRAIFSARAELEDLKANCQTVENATTAPTVIEHRPTPIAKTVFGQEIHFRLAGGRLCFVPWDELVEALKRDAPQRAYKLKDADSFTESLGPIRGFRMDYTLRRGRHVAPVAGGGISPYQTIELDRFTLVPVTADLGEPLDQALRQGSELQAVLSRYESKRAAVTVWVYPDSYGQFRKLNSYLLDLGFLCSARPMPEGLPIGGSPEGSRSAAQ